MLKSEIQDPVWFFDLEWVPDAAGAARLYGMPPDVTEEEAIQKVWEETKGYHKDDCPRPFVKYSLSKIVSIAFLSRRIVYTDSVRRTEFGLHSLPKLPLNGNFPPEGQIIYQFLHYVGVREPQLVGFNSLESDLQVLIQRALINEVRADLFCKRPDAPWRGRDYFDSKNSEWHLDLIQRFSRSSAMTPRLNDLAKLCGFPGKLDVDGAHVVDLWLRGDVDAIVKYNQIDALNTYLVWLRTVNFACKISEEDYVTEQDDFREFLDREAEKEANDHIRAFLEKWDES